MMEIGKMISMMDKELKVGKAIPLFIKEIINKAKKQGRESFNLMEILMKVIFLMVNFMVEVSIILPIRTQRTKVNFIRII